MLDKYADDTVEQVKNQYGFTVPWELIIELVLEMMEGCLDETNLVDTAHNPTRIQKAMLTVALKRNGLRRRNALKVRDTMLEQAASRDAATLLSGLAQTQDGFGLTNDDEE